MLLVLLPSVPARLFRFYDVDRNAAWTQLEYVSWWARYRPPSALVQ